LRESIAGQVYELPSREAGTALNNTGFLFATMDSVVDVKGLMFGTGFVTAAKIVSNAHVVEDAADICRGANKLGEGKVVRREPDDDVAIMTMPGMSIASLSLTAPQVGDKVYMMQRHPVTNKFIGATMGTLLNGPKEVEFAEHVSGVPPVTRVWTHNIPGVPGNSGSPIILAGSRSVVGMYVGGKNGVNFMVSSEVIARLLGVTLSKRPVPNTADKLPDLSELKRTLPAKESKEPLPTSTSSVADSDRVIRPGGKVYEDLKQPSTRYTEILGRFLAAPTTYMCMPSNLWDQLTPEARLKYKAYAPVEIDMNVFGMKRTEVENALNRIPSGDWKLKPATYKALTSDARKAWFTLVLNRSALSTATRAGVELVRASTTSSEEDEQESLGIFVQNLPSLQL